MLFGDPKRAKRLIATLLICDGVIALACPREDALFWKRGPKFWRSLMGTLADRPNLIRAIGAAEVAVAGGILWTLDKEESD
ncbi:MAG: hypothetical protein V4555_11335 [Acidobacteriota bacterium]